MLVYSGLDLRDGRFDPCFSRNARPWLIKRVITLTSQIMADRSYITFGDADEKADNPARFDLIYSRLRR